MKVTLVFPPVYGVDLPHLGLSYIAAKLREERHSVEVLCLNSRLYHEAGNAKHLWDWYNANLWLHYDKIRQYFDIEKVTDRWVAEILSKGPQVIGFCVNTHSRMFANILATKVRKAGGATKIIFGGPLCSEGLGSLDDLNPDVDVYVKGEGEDIVKILLDRIERHEPLTGIAGTIVRENRVFKDHGENSGFAEIDKIPFPAFDLFPMADYENRAEIPIIFSRGCHYACRFCCDKPIWGRYRMRDPGSIVEEIRRHQARYGRSRFKCNDLLVNGDLQGLERLADLLIEAKLGVSWGGMARARKDMSLELLKKMKAAGCEYLTFGVESGSGKILKFMGKPSPREVSVTLKRVHAAGIQANTLWMVGHPKETALDLLKTFWFLFRNRGSITEFVNVSPCYIPKNSLLGKQEKSLGIQYDAKSDWYIEEEGNSFELRQKRAEQLRRFARLLGLYRGGITPRKH